MGMSTHIIGFKPPDDKWRKMKAVWDACEAASVEPPAEVEKFFEYETPDVVGVRVTCGALTDCGAVVEWRDDTRDGFEVHVGKLPPDVTVLRFYNSW
jgi:hypothetical protein